MELEDVHPGSQDYTSLCRLHETQYLYSFCFLANGYIQCTLQRMGSKAHVTCLQILLMSSDITHRTNMCLSRQEKKMNNCVGILGSGGRIIDFILPCSTFNKQGYNQYLSMKYLTYFSYIGKGLTFVCRPWGYSCLFMGDYNMQSQLPQLPLHLHTSWARTEIQNKPVREP